MTIERTIRPLVESMASRHPVVTITGPRQSGKTTLCRSAFPTKPYASLENPTTRDFATQDPAGFLAQFPSGVVLDEVQRVAELLSFIQGIVDEHKQPGEYILTGSQHFGLLESVSQSLAGRTAIVHLYPLDRAELRRFPNHPVDLFETLFSGGYPAIYDRSIPPSEWIAAYVATYVERDLRQVLEVRDLVVFQRFLRLCAGRTAQLLNLSALAADAGITHNTARAWISVLETSFIVFRLAPFHANIRKRLVKTPKLHFVDTGLVCYLLGIRSPAELVEHPQRGAIFETWVVSEILKARAHANIHGGLFFFRDRHGTEVDLLIQKGSGLLAVEAKSGQSMADDFWRNLEAVDRFLGTEARLGRALVYGGDSPQRRAQGNVIPWSSIDENNWR